MDSVVKPFIKSILVSHLNMDNVLSDRITEKISHAIYMALRPYRTVLTTVFISYVMLFIMSIVTVSDVIVRNVKNAKPQFI